MSRDTGHGFATAAGGEDNHRLSAVPLLPLKKCNNVLDFFLKLAIVQKFNGGYGVIGRPVSSWGKDPFVKVAPCGMKH